MARPGSVALFGGIAAALDVTFLPMAAPGEAALAYHLTAVTMTMLMIAATLLHESGHAVAYRLQHIWPVRITLRLSGGACGAVVDEDTPLRAAVRALAGPAVTACIVGVFLALWHLSALPPLYRVGAAALAFFSLSDLVFNTLPVHPRCDGTHALRAVLWLAQGKKPDDFSVLYLWRPVILAASMLVIPPLVEDVGYLPSAPEVAVAAVCGALALCAVPPLAIIWRRLDSAVASLPARH